MATTEMRLCMLRIIERALEAHPSVTPTLFVDDVSAESTGPDGVIVKELGGFIDKVAQDIEEVGMELSRKNRSARRTLPHSASGWRRGGKT